MKLHPSQSPLSLSGELQVNDHRPRVQALHSSLSVLVADKIKVAGRSATALR